MAEQGRVPEQSYRAFISYSHRDDVAARALHRRLETYRLPRHLIGSDTARGAVPQRLTPIFRDLDELSAADDLSVEIKAALARSEVLIIVASPAAKASKWVNLEIETFRALHGAARPVLVALIEGEPADAFPPALTAGGLEPVAADFRKSAAGGKRLALLKLVAGITAAPLDALVQRDAQRQYRRVMAITGSALAAVLVMALLLVVALRSQAEAQRQRQEAEGLVEYMLTDLRDKLKGVGRLDVMTAVNERAMKYYGGQRELEKLSAGSLERRARILHAMGEDDEKRGNLKLALQKFEEAHRATAAALSRNPDDPDTIFAHAQSEYWMGRISEQEKNWPAAFERYSNYEIMSRRLINIDNSNSEYAMERGWGYLNIGIVHTLGFKNYSKARNLFHESKKWFEISFSKRNDDNVLYEIANSYAWIADTYYYENNISKSIENRIKQVSIQTKLYKSSNNNANLYNLIVAKRALAKNYTSNRSFYRSSYILEECSKDITNLVEFDDTNEAWKNMKKLIDSDIVFINSLIH